MPWIYTNGDEELIGEEESSVSFSTDGNQLYLNVDIIGSDSEYESLLASEYASMAWLKSSRSFFKILSYPADNSSELKFHLGEQNKDYYSFGYIDGYQKNYDIECDVTVSEGKLEVKGKYKSDESWYPFSIHWQFSK